MCFSQGLAAEVVALEEKLLHFRSEELRRESQREGQASPSASAAALRMLRAQVESANGDKARLEGEVEALHQTVAQLKTELRIASEAAASAPMAEDSAARPLSAGMASPTVDTSVQTDGPMNGHISPRDGRGNGIEQAHPSGGSNGAGAPSPIFDGVVDRDMVQDPASPPRPPPSALVAAAAMERFERDAAAGTPTVNGPPEGDMQMPAVPAELRSLLPALTWVPGLDDQVDPGIAPVVERIFDALEALAKEREEAAAAGVQRQQEAEALRAANAALQGRLEAMQAQLELGTQQRLAGTASG